jgi:alcohol dehydrogenase (NADP+)
VKMGATKFIATNEENRWWKKHAATLDLIICTVSSNQLPLASYVSLLRTRGQFIMVGAPEDKLPALNVFHLIGKKAKIGGSAIGSPKQIREMLDLAVRMKVKPWIQPRPMADANQAIQDLEHGKPRYRYVLENPGSERLGKL